MNTEAKVRYPSSAPTKISSGLVTGPRELDTAPHIGFSDAASALDPITGKGKVLSVALGKIARLNYAFRVTLLGPLEAECQAQHNAPKAERPHHQGKHPGCLILMKPCWQIDPSPSLKSQHQTCH